VVQTNVAFYRQIEAGLALNSGLPTVTIYRSTTKIKCAPALYQWMLLAFWRATRMGTHLNKETKIVVALNEIHSLEVNSSLHFKNVSMREGRVSTPRLGTIIFFRVLLTSFSNETINHDHDSSSSRKYENKINIGVVPIFFDVSIPKHQDIYKVPSVETNKSAFTNMVVLVPIGSDIYSIVQAAHMHLTR
jgi:hypothetical protein